MLVNIDSFDEGKISFSIIKHNKEIQILYNGEEFLLESPENLTSFGLNENISLKKDLTGYKLPVLLWSKNFIREEEIKFITILNKITEKVKAYVKNEIFLKNKNLKSLNPIYYKTIEGDFPRTKAPKLFLKCIYNRANKKIETIFIDQETHREVNPFTCLRQKIRAKLSIKIDSILIKEDKIDISLKLKECFFKKVKHNSLSLLCPHIDLSKIVTT